MLRSLSDLISFVERVNAADILMIGEQERSQWLKLMQGDYLSLLRRSVEFPEARQADDLALWLRLLQQPQFAYDLRGYGVQDDVIRWQIVWMRLLAVFTQCVHRQLGGERFPLVRPELAAAIVQAAWEETPPASAWLAEMFPTGEDTAGEDRALAAELVESMVKDSLWATAKPVASPRPMAAFPIVQDRLAGEAELITEDAAPFLPGCAALPDVRQVLVRGMDLDHFSGYARAARIFADWSGSRPDTRKPTALRIRTDVWSPNRLGGADAVTAPLYLVGRSSDGAILRATVHRNLLGLRSLSGSVRVITSIAIQGGTFYGVEELITKVGVFSRLSFHAVAILEVFKDQEGLPLIKRALEGTGIRLARRSSPGELLDGLTRFWRMGNLPHPDILVSRRDLMAPVLNFLGDPASNLLFVLGERGVGKTTLVAQCICELSALGPNSPASADENIPQAGPSRGLVFDMMVLDPDKHADSWVEVLYDSIREALKTERVLKRRSELTDRERNKLASYLIRNLAECSVKTLLILENVDRWPHPAGIAAFCDELVGPTRSLQVMVLATQAFPGMDDVPVCRVPKMTDQEMLQLLENTIGDQSRLATMSSSQQERLLRALDGNARLGQLVGLRLAADASLSPHLVVSQLEEAPTDKLRGQIGDFFASLSAECQQLIRLLAAIRLPVTDDELLPLLRLTSERPESNHGNFPAEDNHDRNSLAASLRELERHFIVGVKDPASWEVSLLAEYQEAISDSLMQALTQGDPSERSEQPTTANRSLAVSTSEARSFYELGRIHYERRIQSLSTGTASSFQAFMMFEYRKGLDAMSEWLRCLIFSTGGKGPDGARARGYALTFRFLGLLGWWGEVAPFKGLDVLLASAQSLPSGVRDDRLLSLLKGVWSLWPHTSGVLSPPNSNWRRVDTLLEQIQHHLDTENTSEDEALVWGRDGAQWLHAVRGALLTYRSRCAHYLGRQVHTAYKHATIESFKRSPWSWWPAYSYVYWAQHAWLRGDDGTALDELRKANDSRDAHDNEICSPMLETAGLLLLTLNRPKEAASAFITCVYQRWWYMHAGHHITTNYAARVYEWTLCHLWSLMSMHFAEAYGYSHLRTRAVFSREQSESILRELWSFWRPYLHPGKSDHEMPDPGGFLEHPDPLIHAAGVFYPVPPPPELHNRIRKTNLTQVWHPNIADHELYDPSAEEEAFFKDRQKSHDGESIHRFCQRRSENPQSAEVKLPTS